MPVNEGTICGETPTLAGTLLTEVTIRPLEQSAGTALMKGSPHRSDNSRSWLYETMP